MRFGVTDVLTRALYSGEDVASALFSEPVTAITTAGTTLTAVVMASVVRKRVPN